MPLSQRYLGGKGTKNGARCIREEWSMPPEGYGRRVQVWVPSSGRNDEQGYLQAIETLCRNTAFRQEIQKLRDLYLDNATRRDPIDSNRASVDAQSVCTRWGFYGEEWVIWLIEHWDPRKSDLPPKEPIEITPPLASWVLKLEIVGEPGVEARPRQGTLTFASAISVREAQRAARVTVNLLRSPIRKKGVRPGLTQLDRDMLQGVFQELGIAPARGREKIIRNAKELTEIKGRPLSKSTVASEYRRWLKEHGQPIKRYDRY